MNLYDKGELMIKNIIFDFGNVLVDYKMKEFMLAKGIEPDMIKRLLKASVMGPYWDEFDRGALTEEEAFAGFISIDPGIEKELHMCFDNITGMLTKRDFATKWIMDLKAAGYNVYYLSNYSKKACVECADSIDFIKYMDGGVLSNEELLVKPDPEIYKRLIDRYSLNPAECVFIDDTEKNVDAAVKLGMQGIVYTSKEETDQALKALGVEY